MSTLSLIVHNVGVRKVRSGLTVLAVAIGVMTVVTLGLVNGSIRASALALMQTGTADFTVAQKGVSDILNSNVDESDVATIKSMPGVADAVGVLLATVRFNHANPMFLEIGLPAGDVGGFGVRVVAGRVYGADATGEVMLGWRAARNLHKAVGDPIVIDSNSYRIVGLYETGQALGETGAMFPLTTMQANQRQSGEVSLVFVRTRPAADIPAVRAAIERGNPTLVTIRTTSEFGRADRSMQLINAADSGTRVLAIAIGALIVMSTMTIAFIERIREFGVLRAVGWTRLRILGLVMGEAGFIGLMGAAAGVALSFIATKLLQQTPSLVGILDVVYNADTFWRALYTAGGMTLIGALYPALRAASLAPLEALRHE